MRRQLEDWQAAVAFTRQLDGVDPERIAVWGMSLGGGHALMIAAADRRVASVVALVPLADGLALTGQPGSPTVLLRIILSALREMITRRPVFVPVAGPPGSFAVNTEPEALPGLTRLTVNGDWRNQVSSSGLLAVPGFRPIRRATRIVAPVLLQLGEHDAMVPPSPIEKTATRLPHSELLRYPIDHFECFTPAHIQPIADDQIDFLTRHLTQAKPIVA